MDIFMVGTWGRWLAYGLILAAVGIIQADLTDEKGNPLPEPDQIGKDAFYLMDEMAKKGAHPVDILYRGLSHCSGAYAGISIAVIAVVAAAAAVAAFVAPIAAAISSATSAALSSMANTLGVTIGTAVAGSSTGSLLTAGFTTTTASALGGAGGATVLGEAAAAASVATTAGATAVTATAGSSVAVTTAGVVVGEATATNILAASVANAIGWTSSTVGITACKAFVDFVIGLAVGIPTTVPMSFIPQQADPLTKCHAYVRDHAGFVFFQRTDWQSVTAPAYISIENDTPYYLILSFDLVGAPLKEARVRYAIPPSQNPENPSDKPAKRILYPLKLYWLNAIKLEVFDDERGIDLGMSIPSGVRSVWGKRCLIDSLGTNWAPNGSVPGVNEIIYAKVTQATLAGGQKALQLSDCRGVEPKAKALARGGSGWLDQTQAG